MNTDTEPDLPTWIVRASYALVVLCAVLLIGGLAAAIGGGVFSDCPPGPNAADCARRLDEKN